jgi:hypothetical protein
VGMAAGGDAVTGEGRQGDGRGRGQVVGELDAWEEAAPASWRGDGLLG